MPSSFAPERPLTRSEYARRRDQTTKEELDKLYSTPEFKNFSTVKNKSKHNPVTEDKKMFKRTNIIVIAFISLILAFNIMPRRVTDEQTLDPSNSTSTSTHRNIGAVDDVIEGTPTDDNITPYTTILKHEDEQKESVVYKNNCACDIYLVEQLTAELNTAYAQLDGARRANIRIIDELYEERNVVATLLLASENSQQENHQQQHEALKNDDSLPIGVLVTLLACLSAVSASLSITNRRMRRTLDDMAHQLRQVAFEKDTAEQSVSILEMELQRKVKQLAEAQQLVAVKGEPPGSPRIRAIRQPNTASPSASTPPPSGLITPTTGCDSLPPPPRQLVERFLQERGAIAVEQEQVHAWLEMEGHFGHLQREAATLRAIVEGKHHDGEELRERLDELTQALQEQKQVAQQAKAALRQVRAYATKSPGRNDDDDEEEEKKEH